METPVLPLTILTSIECSFVEKVSNSTRARVQKEEQFVGPQHEMLFISHITLLYVLLLRYSDCSKSFVKPSFPNYCEMNHKCKPICNCEIHINCSLLPMDETVRKTILFYHNQIREIQSAGDPQPSGMTMLNYDMQLEEISKCWAARCDNEHSDCFKTYRFSSTSQSVGSLILEGEETPNVFLWLQMMSYWLGQAEVVTPNMIHSLPVDPKMHNFGQLMSDNVLSVGCAWSIFTNNWLLFVCTYGPRGPHKGEAIYSTGYPCSRCPENYSCDYVKPFERLCKSNLDESKPLEPSPSVRKEEIVPQVSTLLQPNHLNMSNMQASEFRALAELPSWSENPIFRRGTKATPARLTSKPVSRKADNVQGYQPPPRPPPLQPPSHRESKPTFPPSLFKPHESSLTSAVPQYIPQPPPLPRYPLVPKHPDEEEDSVFHQLPQSTEFPHNLPIPVPPDPEALNPRIVPQQPPPRPHYPYVPIEYYPSSGEANIDPPIPARPSLIPYFGENYRETPSRGYEMASNIKYPVVANPMSPLHQPQFASPSSHFTPQQPVSSEEGSISPSPPCKKHTDYPVLSTEANYSEQASVDKLDARKLEKRKEDSWTEERSSCHSKDISLMVLFVGILVVKLTLTMQSCF